jgi:hypothetical protein
MFPALLVATVAALAPFQDAKPEKTIALVRAVPKDALFFVQATQIDALRTDFLGSAWYAFYRDDELKALRDSCERLFHLAEDKKGEKGKSLEEQLGVDPWDYLESIHGSIALFGVSQPGHDDPALAVLFDPGEKRGKFEELYPKLQEKEADAIKSTAEYAGVELTLYEEQVQPKPEEKPKEENEDEEEESDEEEEVPDLALAHSAYFDTGTWAGFAAAGSREELLGIVHGMIDRMSGKDPSNGVEGSEAVASARASVSKPGRIEAFVDLSKLVAKLQEKDPPGEEEKRVLDALALDDLRWIYATADVGAGEKLGAELSIRLPESGYLREWIGCLSPFPREMAALAPRASTSITLAQFDLWAMWQSVWKMMHEIDPESTQKARDQMTTTLQQMGGLDVEKGLVSQFDGRYMAFNVQVPPEEWRAAFAGALGAEAGTEPAAPTTGSATVIGLKDAAVVSGFVKGLMTAVGIYPQVETEEFQGTTIHKLKMGESAGYEWAFTKKNTCVISQFPTALRAALRMEGAEAKDSALEIESFKPLYTANANAAVLGLASTPESLKTGLAALQFMAPFIGMGMARGYEDAGGKGKIENPFEHLPTSTTIEKHFKGTIVTSLTRKSGVLHAQLSSQ